MSKYDADSGLHCQRCGEGDVVARGQHPAVLQVEVQGAGRVVLEGRGGEGRGGEGRRRNEELRSESNSDFHYNHKMSQFCTETILYVNYIILISQ